MNKNYEIAKITKKNYKESRKSRDLEPRTMLH